MTDTTNEAAVAAVEKTKAKRSAKKAAATPAKKAVKAGGKKTPAKKVPAKKVPKPKKAGPVDRSAAIAESWRDKKVAAARSMKHKVKTGGEIYNSVKAAFEALKLPLGQHIKFRGQLKAAPNGATFDGRKFTLVKHAD